MFKKFMMKELVIHSKNTKQHGTIEYFLPYWLITSVSLGVISLGTYIFAF